MLVTQCSNRSNRYKPKTETMRHGHVQPNIVGAGELLTSLPSICFCYTNGIHIVCGSSAARGQEPFNVPLKAPCRHLRRLLLKTSLPRCRRSVWGCPARPIRKISSERSSPTMTSGCPATLTFSLSLTRTQSQFRLKRVHTSVAWHQSGLTRLDSLAEVIGRSTSTIA